MEEIYNPEEYQLVSPGESEVDETTSDLPETPDDEESFRLPALYKEDVRGEYIVWTIRFDGEQLWSIHGKYLSENYQEDPFDVTPKAKRTLLEQALLMARAKYKNKYVKGGYRTVLGAKKKRMGAMLCARFEEGKTKFIYPMAVQTKLNGIRLFVDKIEGTVKGLTRQNEEVSHLILIEECDKFLDFFPQDTRLDGEVFLKGVPLTDISSWFRGGRGKGGKVTSGYKVESETLQYHIYDIITPLDENYK